MFTDNCAGAQVESSTAEYTRGRSLAQPATTWLTTWCLRPCTASSATTETRRCAAMSLRWGWATPSRSPTLTRAESEWLTPPSGRWVGVRPGLDWSNALLLASQGGSTPTWAVSRPSTCWCGSQGTEPSWCGSAASPTPMPYPSGSGGSNSGLFFSFIKLQVYTFIIFRPFFFFFYILWVSISTLWVEKDEEGFYWP